MGVPTGPRDHRARVTAFLAFLTSDACLKAVRHHIGAEPLAAELCRLWFDEIYVPGTTYLHSLKGDRSEAALHQFEACFSDEERAKLERFHGFLELRIDMAANRVKGRAFFPENDSWASVRRDAARLLETLAPDPDHVRDALAGLVGALLRRSGHSHALEGTLRLLDGASDAEGS